jgi:hypothetical protein
LPTPRKPGSMYGWSWRAKLEAIVIKGEPDECWRADPDKCSIDQDGYAHFHAADTTEHLVHRAAVIADGREIPEGYEVDHVADVCRYRDCANPAHLEAVPKLENLRRSNVRRVLPPSFPCGHDRALNAFSRSKGCRACKREYDRSRAVENRLRAEVCAGRVSLAAAQLAIASDWETAP